MRKSMKLSLLFLSLVVLVFSLTACGNKNEAGYTDIDAAKAQQLITEQGAFILDVREPEEYAEGHIPGTTLIPYGQIPNRLKEIPKDKPVVVLCATGSRSAVVSDYLAKNGFSNIYNLKTGLVSWTYQIEK